MPAVATVITHFQTNISQSLYIHPTMDFRKAKSFIDAVNPALGTDLAINDILVLFEERKGQGLAITSSHLVLNIEMAAGMLKSLDPPAMAGMFSLDSLVEAPKVSKSRTKVHRRLTIRLAGDHTLSFVLTKGNQGAEEIGRILQRCIGTV